VVLAAVALLGWVREPEKDRFPEKANRTTFQIPQDTYGPPVVRALPGDAEPLTAEPNRLPRRTQARKARGHSTGYKIAEPAESGERGRQDTSDRDTRAADTPQIPEERVETREPQPDLRTRPEEDSRADRRNEQTLPTVLAKDSSKRRSALLIAGAAAAGTAIGGLSGGGKGAAIGAITGGAGGYVYDRMTRRRSASPDITYRDPSRSPESFEERSYSSPTLARQFGTPGFAGR